MGWQDDEIIDGGGWQSDPIVSTAPAPPKQSPMQWLGAEIRGVPSQIPRQLGIAGRSVIEAATGLPGMAADATVDLKNRVTGKTPLFALKVPSEGLPSNEFGKVLDKAGLPRPETAGERIMSFGVGAMTGSKLPQIPTPSRYATPEGFTGYAPRTQTEETFAKARDAGYVVPPSALRPNAATVGAESVAGKAALKQTAQIKNQEVTDELAKAGLGLDKRSTVSEETFKEIRQTAGKVYNEVEKIGGDVLAGQDKQFVDDVVSLGDNADEILAQFPDANVGKSKEVQDLAASLLREKFSTKAAIDYAKELRQQAKGNLSFINMQDPAKRSLGYAQRDAAAALEDAVMRNLASKGRGDLAQKFNDARTLIAKSHSAEAAFNPSTGHFIAENLSAQLKRRVPLSNEFRQIADFSRAFRQFGGAPGGAALASPGVSALDYAMAAGGGIAGAAAAGGPVGGALALGLPAARLTARYGLLTNPVQNSLLPRPAAGPIRPELFGGALGGLLAQ